VKRGSALGQSGGVHGSKSAVLTKLWRNKPLFADNVFKTGTEASQLLMDHALLKDSGSTHFLQSWESTVNSLAVVFDRMPKYAWVMKQLLEPDRTVTFRVAWIDDNGISRLNRGFRVQYSSALGPYEGGLAFGRKVNYSYVKSAAFDTVFVNALSRKHIGGAYGGSDFEPSGKSDTEIQRFCQSFMTELAKYVGPDSDLPGLGDGVSPAEIGYLYGQYKRIHQHHGQLGTGLLWGGAPAYQSMVGYGVVQFAKKMLADKNMNLNGKRILITGNKSVALSVGEKLLEAGAVPIVFSDTHGYIHEPDGFDLLKIKTVQKIQTERDARIGRYIVSSTTAKFSDDFGDLFDIPCDFVFACAGSPSIHEADVQKLAQHGCKGVIEGVHQGISNNGILALKKRNLLFAPYKAATIGSALINGYSIAQNPLVAGETMEGRVDEAISRVFDEIKATGKEFNTRGDLNAAANIAAFLRVANVMMVHGAV